MPAAGAQGATVKTSGARAPSPTVSSQKPPLAAGGTQPAQKPAATGKPEESKGTGARAPSPTGQAT